MYEDRLQYDSTIPVETPSTVTATIDQEPGNPSPTTHRPATANAISTTPALASSYRRASLSERLHSELYNRSSRNGQPQKEAGYVSRFEESNQEVASPPVIVDHQQPVATLRKYYTELDTSVQPPNEPSTLQRRGSYTLPAGTRLKAESVPNVDRLGSELNVRTDDMMTMDAYNDRAQRHAASVEELRQIFERGELEQPERELRPSMRRQNSSHRRITQPIHGTMSKSVEFFSRPPKYRTPSPRPTNLPTPPPLPLPPSSPEMMMRMDRPGPPRSRNYVTRFNQCAQPIVSMHMPFRSRSLALDRGGWSSETIQVRPRTGSITQRSVSPLPQTTTRGRSRRKHVTHSSRSMQTNNPIRDNEHCSSQPGCYFHGKENLKRVSTKGTQSPAKNLVPYTTGNIKLPETDVIRLSPTDTDGVYVRSAVVYERVADRTEVGGTRHFVTTYVISQGPSPSRSTVQATNLWVAEQALLSAGGTGEEKQTTTLPPYRTQTLSRLEQERLDRNTETRQTKRGQTMYSSCRVTDRPTQACSRPRSLSTTRRRTTRKKTADYSPEPQPLPTPPPADMHRYLLRCGSQEAGLDQKPLYSSMEKVVQWEKPCFSRTRKCSVSPTRTWSVRSLSPPPFRTPWLSSMGSVRSKRSTSKSPFPQDTKPSDTRDNENEQMPTYNEDSGLRPHRSRVTHTHPSYCGNCSRSPIGVYELDRARQREARAREEWVRRAESVSRERQAYHHLRGSWSPPLLRSPARNTPNNLEEQTEREIRYRVRQHKPLSPVPIVPMPVYPTRDSVAFEPIVVDEAVQCGEPTADDTNRNNLNEETEFGGIDTTPITENFDGKRAYFEELIRTNQLLARCSFCSDCYHCPHGRTPRYSCCSSWDSELHHACSPVYTKGTAAIARTDPTKTSKPFTGYQDHGDTVGRRALVPTKLTNSGLFDSQETEPCEPITHRVYKVESIREPARYGPQQYASSLCLTSYPTQGPSFQPGHSRSEKTFVPAYESQSIQHDYYARPQMAMPKVAPNPPNRELAHTSQYYKWTSLGTDRSIQPSRAELIHSPTTTNYPVRNPTYLSRDYLRVGDEHHSPGCRFYDRIRGNINKGDSWESLNGAPNESEPVYRGKVKQIVCELNERAVQETHVEDETYPTYSTADLRRSLRYN